MWSKFERNLCNTQNTITTIQANKRFYIDTLQVFVSMIDNTKTRIVKERISKTRIYLFSSIFSVKTNWNPVIFSVANPLITQVDKTAYVAVSKASQSQEGLRSKPKYLPSLMEPLWDWTLFKQFFTKSLVLLSPIWPFVWRQKGHLRAIIC